MADPKDMARDIFLNATGLRNLAAKKKELAEAIDIILDTIENSPELLKKFREVLGTDKLSQLDELLENVGETENKTDTPQPEKPKYRYQVVLGANKGEIFTDEDEAKKAVADLVAAGCDVSDLLIKEEIKEEANETADANSDKDDAQP